MNAISKRYENIAFKTFPVKDLVSETPLLELWENPKLNRSQYYLSHLSDVVRIALLMKFGGTYMDTDIVTLHEFPQGRNNWVALEEKGSINGAILKFQKGHEILNRIADRLGNHPLSCLSSFRQDAKSYALFFRLDKSLKI